MTLFFSAPGSLSVVQGVSTALTGADLITLEAPGSAADATFTVTISDLYGVLTDTGTGVAGVVGSGTDSITITGTLAQVNADLAALVDTDGSLTPDRLVLSAHDSSDNVTSDEIGVSVESQFPQLTAPGSLTLVQGVATPLTGGDQLSVAQEYPIQGETFSVSLFDVNGVLDDTGMGVSGVVGSGTGTLTITGTLAQVNTDLAAVTDTDSTLGPDQLVFSVQDAFGDVSSQAIGVSVGSQFPELTTPGSLTLMQGVTTPLTGGDQLSVAQEYPIAGETFTVSLFDLNGVLDDTGTGVSGVVGSGTDTLTITGTLAQVNTDLAAVTDTDSTVGPDQLAFSVRDAFGDVTTQNIEVSVAACFCLGTRILTARGEIAVEALRVGDRAMALRAGALLPIRWIGRRRLDLRSHPQPERVRPIRVSAGAFADGQPHRELWLSPGHSVFLTDEGVLIQIEKLINGATIVQIAQDEVSYWHVELDRHDVLLANGMPAESYLDTGNRSAFADAAAATALHPDFLPRHPADTCAPLVTAGPALAAAKARLQRRAEAAGYEVTASSSVHLLADGRALAPDRPAEGLHRFAVPAGAADIRLVSRVWVPAHMLPDSSDARTLGVCVRRVLVDGRNVPLDDAALGDGWHAVEADEAGRFRWTAGSARLPAARASVAVELIGGESAYWREPGPATPLPRSSRRSVGRPAG